MNHPLLMMNLMSALYWFDEALQSHFQAQGRARVSRAQSLLLANIAAGEHRATRLARNLGVSRQAISQMLSDMEAAGLVSVGPDPADRRARIVSFHPAAEELREVARQVLADLEAELGRRIGADVLDQLRAALQADWGPSPLAGTAGG